jgi:hypothetical protein
MPLLGVARPSHPIRILWAASTLTLIVTTGWLAGDYRVMLP